MVWRARNEAVFNNKKPDPIKIAFAAADFAAEYAAANSSRSFLPIQIQQVSAQDPLPRNCLFVDAGSFIDGTTCWGLCAVNSEGIISYSECKIDQIAVDPVMVEALGIRWSIQQVLERNMEINTIFSDAQVVTLCIANRSSVASIEHIGQDCRSLLDLIPGCAVNFVRREGNLVAHSLVGLAERVGNRSWLGPPPVNCTDTNVVMPVVGSFPRIY